MAWTDSMKSAAVGAATSGVIGAAASVASGLLANAQQKKLLKAQQEYQTKEREASQRWQEDQWRAQTLYNSPAATMARLREIGLSPDMMYGQNGVSAMLAGNMPVAPTHSSPSVPTPAGTGSFNQAAEQATNVAKNVAEVKNIEANTRKQEEETKYLDILGKVGEADVVLKGVQTEFTREQKLELQAKIKQINANVSKQLAEIEKIFSETELNKQSLFELKESWKERFKTFALNNRQLDDKHRLDQKELEYIDEYMEEYIDLMRQQCFQAQQTGASIQLSNIMERANQEAIARMNNKNKKLGKDSYADMYVKATIGMMTGNAEMVQEQLDVFKSYGAFNAIMDGIGLLVGSCLGAFIGARVPKAGTTLPKNRPMIGFGR